MSAAAKPPRPVLLAAAGALAGVLAAVAAGEPVWSVLGPEPPDARPDRLPKEERPAPPRPDTEPRLAVTAAAVSVYPGGKNAFGVRVRRDRFDGPVTVRFEAAPGLTVAEVTLPAGQNGAQAEVVAAPEAKPETYALTASAVAVTDTHTLRARTPVAVTVAALPPPPPRLALTMSPKIPVYQGGRNEFAVRVARAGFDGPVAVTFDGLPDGVTIPPVAVPVGKAEAVAAVGAAAGAKLGTAVIRATATAAPTLSAVAEASVEVLDPRRAPLDVVLVMDCTGSMAKSGDLLRRSWPAFAAALAEARFDVLYGLVGFRDTTLGQPLESADFGRGGPMTADPGRVAAALRDLRFGGGGGEGESSLDGLARASDYPLRRGAAARVLVLVTDGVPKRADRRVKKIDDLVEHFRARDIDQLHVVAVPDHRKRFEPLWAGPKGEFFDLKAATERDEMGALVAGLAKAIASAVPPQPEPKPEAAAPAATAALPEPKAAAPPAARDPDEPQLPPLQDVPASPPGDQVAAGPAQAPAKPSAARAVGWAAAVAGVATVLLFFGAMAIPGERPTGAARAAGYGGGVPVGLIAGALGFVALDALGVPLLARLGAAALFGFALGLSAALAERVFPPPLATPAAPVSPLPAKPQAAKPVPRSPQKTHTPVSDLDIPPVEAYPAAPPKPPPPALPPLLDLDVPPVEPPTPPKPLLDLDLPPVEPYPGAPKSPVPPAPQPGPPAHKPNITGAPKPGDCPGCRRPIPGAPGTRYCMVCDKTF
jgi:Mg-chelatase subunit ChlD